jgi:hypothetical protein
VLEPLPTAQLLAVAAGVRRARHEAVESPPPPCAIEHAPTDLASRAGAVPPRGAPAR